MQTSIECNDSNSKDDVTLTSSQEASSTKSSGKRSSYDVETLSLDDSDDTQGSNTKIKNISNIKIEDIK